MPNHPNSSGNNQHTNQHGSNRDDSLQRGDGQKGGEPPLRAASRLRCAARRAHQRRGGGEADGTRSARSPLDGRGGARGRRPARPLAINYRVLQCGGQEGTYAELAAAASL